jgi:hypothetical protein
MRQLIEMGEDHMGGGKSLARVVDLLDYMAS